MDPRTRLILFKLLNQGFFRQIDGCLSTGKEANVYYAVGGEVRCPAAALACGFLLAYFGLAYRRALDTAAPVPQFQTAGITNGNHEQKTTSCSGQVVVVVGVLKKTPQQQGSIAFDPFSFFRC